MDRLQAVLRRTIVNGGGGGGGAAELAPAP